MKSQARVVVIGGGVVGCSILYHLTKFGWSDVVLLERAELTAGSTWHAAGGMHTLNSDPNVAALQAYTIKLYREIENVSGICCGIHETGCLYLAVTDKEVDFFRSERSKARHLALSLEFVDIKEAKRLNPLIDTSDYKAAMFDPQDGYVDPSGVTHAYAEAARKAGAEVYKSTSVTGLNRLPSHEWEVQTSTGNIRTEYVVNAAGLWAREVGRLMNIDLPVAPLEHQYIVTNDIPELAASAREIPVTVDFDGAAYLRQEVHGVVLGTYEQDCRHWAIYGTPLDFGTELLPPDLDRIAEPLSVAISRMPALGRSGIKRVVNGAMVFSPDGNPIIGPIPGQPTAFIAAGVMAGFSQAGGVGLAVARWIIDGEPGIDVFAMDISRFGNFATHAYVLQKTRENYQRRFILPCPNEELDAARPLRTSPVHDELARAGAVFGAVAGWEVPLWFAGNPAEAREAPSFRRTNAFGCISEECRAVRHAAGLWETSSYCKIEVSGSGAARWLDGVVANHVPVTTGEITLCPMLTPRGRLLGDLTIVRLSAERFLIIGSPAAETLYLRALLNHAASQTVSITSRTHALCGFFLTGPSARDIIAAACSSDVSNAGFAFLTARELVVGLAPVLALRISAVGELGYELYMTPEYQRHVYAALMRAGQRLGLRQFGARALNALRLEKGYGVWGREYTQDYSPIEAGLEDLIGIEKPNFVGREAVLTQLAAPPGRKLRLLAIASSDPDPVGGEPVLRDGRAVARLTSAAFGHTVGHALGLAYLPAVVDTATEQLEVEILGARVHACVLEMPPYDPGWPPAAPQPHTHRVTL